MLVLTAAACGIYSSEYQPGSIALYALAVTTVNVILVMFGTAVVGLYAALKLSRFVIACVRKPISDALKHYLIKFFP